MKKYFIDFKVAMERILKKIEMDSRIVQSCFYHSRELEELSASNDEAQI